MREKRKTNLETLEKKLKDIKRGKFPATKHTIQELEKKIKNLKGNE